MIVKKNVNTRNPLSFFVKVTVHIPYNSVCRCELTTISKRNTLTQCAPWCFLKSCLVYSKTHMTRQRFSQAYFKPGAQQNQVTLNEECYKYIFLIICLLCILLVSQLCSHKRFSCCTNFAFKSVKSRKERLDLQWRGMGEWMYMWVSLELVFEHGQQISHNQHQQYATFQSKLLYSSRFTICS